MRNMSRVILQTMASTIRGHIVIVILLLLAFFHATQSITSSKLIQLNEDNWSQILEGEWMVEFFAPWCPACKGLEETWNSFAEWSQDLDIKVAQVDVTANPGLSGRFMVTALPTIYHVLNGQFRQYRGSRDKENFITFIEEKKWESVEEIPSWKSPSSVQMSLVSYFFKLSMFLRSLHTKLIEEYGVPYWGSYLIFALATILIGAILGLLLVCIIDFVFPPKSALPPTPRSDMSFVTTSSEAKSYPDENKSESIKNSSDEKMGDSEVEKNEVDNENIENTEKNELTDYDTKPSDDSENIVHPDAEVISPGTEEVRKRRPARKDE